MKSAKVTDRFTISLSFGIEIMVIQFNEKPHELAEGTTLIKFIENLDIQLQGVAVAINYEVIPKNEWHKTTLKDGMAIMMIHAVSGG